MNIISKLLYLFAFTLILYPLWGMLSPLTFLTELIEDYPKAIEAAPLQVRIVALLMLIGNGFLASALFTISGFINNPNRLYKIKSAGLLLLLYPFVLTVINALSGVVLHSHLTEAALVIELSAQTLFYSVMGLALIGIYQAQKKRLYEL